MLRYLQTLDTRSFLTLLNTSDPGLTKLALGFSFAANGWLYFILLPLIILMRPEQIREFMLLALSAFGLERLIYFTLKNTLRSRRPTETLFGIRSAVQASDQFSLPSGHTSAAFLFVTFLSFGLSPLFFPMYLWAMAVGISRVVLGVHFPADVIMGAVLGTSLALVVL